VQDGNRFLKQTNEEKISGKEFSMDARSEKKCYFRKQLF
jgi:hypothetical protein